MHRRQFLDRYGGGLAGLAASGPRPRAPAPAPYEPTPDLIAAAQREGQVVLYTSTDVAVSERVGKAFEAAYPGIHVQVERSGAERVYQRITQEYGSNIRRADVHRDLGRGALRRVQAQWLARAGRADRRRPAWPAQVRDPEG